MTSQTSPLTQPHSVQMRFRPSAPLRNTTTGLLGTSALLAGLFAYPVQSARLVTSDQPTRPWHQFRRLW